MYRRLGNFISRYPWVVILFWIALTLVLRKTAPAWDDVAHDGDFAYLPDDRPSVIGQRLLAEAFPYHQSKSQIVVLVQRRSGPLTDHDKRIVGYDLARRFRNYYGIAAFQQGKALEDQIRQEVIQGINSRPGILEQRADAAFDAAEDALNDAVDRGENLKDYLQSHKQDTPNAKHSDAAQNYDATKQLAQAYHNLAIVEQYRGDTDQADEDRQRAWSYDEQLAEMAGKLVPPQATDWPLLDVWSWHDPIFDEKLVSKDGQALLIVLLLENEFMATDNIRVLEMVEAEIAEVRRVTATSIEPGLTIGLSGSAAVGGDLLRSAERSIHNTEWITVVLVVVILGLVYRSPLLVAVPIATITVSLLVSTNLIALLSVWTAAAEFSWWEVKVFTTTKIFIVVILFGAGTDFCLFLISRYKEELEKNSDRGQAIAIALAAVGQALSASALTTIVGLSMMFFGEFGKFHHSGPVIGLCLAVALAACVTFAPALLRILGGVVFWPYGLPSPTHQPSDSTTKIPTGKPTNKPSQTGRFHFVWNTLARAITTYPGRILTGCTLLLSPLACFGIYHAGDVTYDFLNALSPSCPSRQGTEILKRHFPIGESGPLIVLVSNDRARFNTTQGHEAIQSLTDQLNAIEGVMAVRSVTNPLGSAKRDNRWSMSTRNLKNRVLSVQKRIEAVFVAQDSSLAGTVTRLELILEHDPFSIQAAEVFARVDHQLHQLAEQTDTYWQGSTFSYTGTTASIRDLREVTQADNLRIQILVVLAVLAVLLVILRKPLVCFYMIATVLFTYFVTMGAIELFFAWAYGATYQGLDWKVPLFLFVILVAIGQDYNVYLATRVFEEQRRLGLMRGLRQAVVRTGGIITSCGIIMAGTFFTMTSGTWGQLVPNSPAWMQRMFSTEGALRGMVELGLALALGVLLDTFIVRPILVPCFLALLARRSISTKTTGGGV